MFTLYDVAGSATGVVIGGLLAYKALAWRMMDLIERLEKLDMKKLDKAEFIAIKDHIDTKFEFHNSQLISQLRAIKDIGDKMDTLLTRRRDDRRDGRDIDIERGGRNGRDGRNGKDGKNGETIKRNND